LSHTSNVSSPFCYWYFGDNLGFLPSSQDHDPPILGFAPFLGWQAHTTIPNSFFSLRWAGLELWFSWATVFFFFFSFFSFLR
jgi:hypothetical protein